MTVFTISLMSLWQLPRPDRCLSKICSFQHVRQWNRWKQFRCSNQISQMSVTPESTISKVDPLFHDNPRGMSSDD